MGQGPGRRTVQQSAPMPSRPGRFVPTSGAASRAVAALLVIALGAACGPTTPSPSPSPSTSSPSPSPTPSVTAPPGTPQPTASVDTAAIYRAIQEQVVAIRGLEPEADVDPQVLDEAELKRRVETSFREDNPAGIVEASERLYKALGLLEEDTSLEDLYLELLGSQVAGFYSPEDDELFVVSRSGDLGVIERVTFAHEYTHALQDQHFDLATFGLDDLTQSDRNIGRLSLIEGDATALMSIWAQQHLTPAETLELLGGSLDPEQMEILARMPAILRESLEFPYTRGLQLVLALQGQGGWEAVDDAYDRPPSSTEQVLHVEKYAADERPIDVALPDGLASGMGQGWSVALEDSFGEFQIGVWLRTILRRVGPANDAAAGWGGDRLAVLKGQSGDWAVAMLTEWDTAADAVEFHDAASEASADWPSGGVSMRNGSTRVTIVIGSDPDVAARLDALVGTTGV